MAITSNNSISMSALRAEYKGGSAAVSMSQLNRGGGHVPLGGSRNTSIPTSDSNLSFSKYRNTSKTVSVTYEIIGGGGGGGFGVDDYGEPYRGTYGGSGGASTLVSQAGTISAAGGSGGENCGGARGSRGHAGASSAYGSGGAGGNYGLSGSAAPSASYGAGGGGGGGDTSSTWDRSGCSGKGGNAGTRKTGTITVSYDSTIAMSLGGGGAGDARGYGGANGAGGYAKFTWDGKSHGRGYSYVFGSSPVSYTIN